MNCVAFYCVELFSHLHNHMLIQQRVYPSFNFIHLLSFH